MFSRALSVFFLDLVQNDLRDALLLFFQLVLHLSWELTIILFD